MLNGSLGADNQFTYGVTATHGGGSVGNAGSANGTYRSPYAVFGASYGKGSGYSQALDEPQRGRGRASRAA